MMTNFTCIPVVYSQINQKSSLDITAPTKSLPRSRYELIADTPS